MAKCVFLKIELQNPPLNRVKVASKLVKGGLSNYLFAFC